MVYFQQTTMVFKGRNILGFDIPAYLFEGKRLCKQKKQFQLRDGNDNFTIYGDY